MRVLIPDAVIPSESLEVSDEGKEGLLYLHYFTGPDRKEIIFALDFEGAARFAGVLVPYLRTVSL